MLIMDTLIAGIALGISILSAVISAYIAYSDEKPYVCLKAIKFVKSDFFMLDIKKESEEIKNIVYSTINSVSVQKFKEKEYLLFNLAKKEADLEKAQLILDPMKCIYSNRGGLINEIQIKKFSMCFREKPGKLHKKDIRANEKIICNDDSEIVIRVAYVCDNDEEMSLNCQKLQNESDFDYIMNTAKAKDIIRFHREEFGFLCKNYKGKKYRKKIVLQLDEIKGLTFEN